MGKSANPTRTPKLGVLEHSGRYSFEECPTFGCTRGREVRVQLDFPSGQRRVATACEKHIAWYAAREVARVRALRGDSPLSA